MQDSVQGPETLKKFELGRQQLIASNNSQANQRMHHENDALIAREKQEQTRIIAKQDEQLIDLSKTVQRLGDNAKTLHTELHDQQRMLSMLDDDMDKETERLNFVMKRMGRLLKTSDTKQLCVIIALIVLFIILLFLVITL